MKREELIALAERCEKATGANRQLDAEIICALDARPEWLRGQEGTLYVASSHFGPRVRWCGARMKRGDGNPDIGELTPHTASLDAALALVGEKLTEPFWRVGNDQDNPGDTFRAELMAFELPKPPIRTIGLAANPALALCAALLKALAHQQADAAGGAT